MKIINFKKHLVYLVLFTGIIISVCAYLYTNICGDQRVNNNLLLTVLIAVFTLTIATYLFMQNVHLNKFNDNVFLKSEKLRTAYELFRKIAGNSFDMIVIFNENLKIEYANRSHLDILGYNLNELKGVSLTDIVTNNFKDSVAYHASRLNSQIKIVNFEADLIHANKKDKIIAEVMLEGFFDSDDNITSYALHCKDITSKRESLKALLKSKRRFKDFANSSADWLWEIDKNMRFIFISSGIVHSIGATNDKFMGKKINSLFNSKALIDDFIGERQLIKDLEIDVKNKDGEDVYLRISAVPVISESKGFVGYRGVARDITNQKKEQERILELATKDHLTGLLNRSAFMFDLEKTIKLSKRNGIKGVLLSVDLDMFKFINDSHGYQAGDKVLLEVASLLKEKLRDTDVIGRVAGDEFAIIMHDITNKEARIKIKSLLQALNKLKIMYRNEVMQVTCSAGAVNYPKEDQNYTQLLTAAGFAMHKAKDLGRNRIYMTEEDYLEDGKLLAKKRMKNLNVLRSRLNNNDFEMYFQPIIPLTKGKSVIFESLLRIRDENNNINSPVVYIDAAESFGLSQQLDISVLRKCIRHFREAQEKHTGYMLSINISGLSLGDDAVYDALKTVVKEEKVDPTKIIIEVTETAAMRDERRAKRFVSNLHSLGFKFALDDFGSGYSSFYYLKNLAVDFVKIDGSFIQNLENSKEDRIFVKALSDLARGLEIEIIAEFVENKKHIDILKELGVDYIQGYYISKPIDGLEEAVVKFDEVTADDI
ncbi:MAG: EAL domain-containing protein [Proteobacteria bacterium]|nr:EAL domain-containing protein [Pseudomonadota bacterium]